VDYKQKLSIKCPTVEQNVGNLSGGNMQKVLLAKWMYADPDILILDEPTRGIDVGAKYEIYCIMNQLVAEGKSVIMISSELPELLGMCDRIYVMDEGEIVGEFEAAEATQEKIMKAILTHNNDNMGKRLTRRQKNNFMNGTNSVINLEESDEENDEENQNTNNKKEEKVNKTEKKVEENINNSKNNETNIENNINNNINKEKENNKVVKGVTKYQDDLLYLKSTLADLLNLFDYSANSPLNNYLRDNSENIFLLHSSFNSMQSLGKTGEIYINELLNLIPENLIEDLNLEKNNSYKQAQSKTKYLDELYTEYEKIKNKLLFYYTSIQSTVKNIRHSGENFEESLVKNDLEFISITEKKYLKRIILFLTHSY